MTFGGTRGREIGGVEESRRRRDEREIGNLRGGCIGKEKRKVWCEEKGGKRER